MEDVVKQSIEELKEGTFASSKIKKAQAFKTGAISGFFLGAVGGWLLRGKPLMYGVIGLVSGGYLGVKINEASTLEPEFEGFSGYKFISKND